MQARRIVITNLREARVEQFELDTEDLQPREVVIRTLVTLISPGTEGASYLGLKSPGRVEDPSYPSRPGYASVGEVVAAGTEANVASGEVVYTTSSHASATRLDTRTQLCVPLPEGLAPEDAVFARMATVSMASLSTTNAHAGDLAAIVGLGLVGNLAAQLCEIAGMPATGLDLLAERCELASACGVGIVLEAPALDDLNPEHALVLECTGTAHGALAALRLAADGGEVSLVGAPWGRGSADIAVHPLLERVFAGYLHLRSGWEWQLPTLNTPHMPSSHERNSRRALELIAQRRLRVRPLLTHTLSPEEAPQAYAGIVDNKAEYLGVVFDWR